MSVSVNDTEVMPSFWQTFFRLRIEHDSDIYSLSEQILCVSQRLIITTEGVSEMIVERHLASHPIKHTQIILRVVVELDIRMTIHNRLDVIVPQVARAVDANTRTELTLQSCLHTMRIVLVVGNLFINPLPEFCGMTVHPTSLLDARLLNVLEDTLTCGIETQHLALVRCVFAGVDTIASNLRRSEIEDGGVVSVLKTFDGLGVLKTEQVFHRFGFGGEGNTHDATVTSHRGVWRDVIWWCLRV